jgi:hypothetical protein
MWLPKNQIYFTIDGENPFFPIDGSRFTRRLRQYPSMMTELCKPQPSTGAPMTANRLSVFFHHGKNSVTKLTFRVEPLGHSGYLER